MDCSTRIGGVSVLGSPQNAGFFRRGQVVLVQHAADHEGFGEVSGNGSSYVVLLSCVLAETKAKAEILDAWADRNEMCAAIVEARQVPTYTLLNLCVNPK